MLRVSQNPLELKVYSLEHKMKSDVIWGLVVYEVVRLSDEAFLPRRTTIQDSNDVEQCRCLLSFDLLKQCGFGCTESDKKKVCGFTLYKIKNKINCVYSEDTKMS